MKTKKTYILAALIVVSVLGSGTAFAKRSFMSVLDKTEGITLTETQRERLETAELEHRKQMIRLRADLSIARLEKHNLLKEKDFKKDAVLTQINKIVAVEKGIQTARLDNHDLIRKVLTDEQWKKYTEELGKHRGGKKGKGHFAGKGPRKGGRRQMSGHGNCPFGGKGQAAAAREAFRTSSAG